MARRGRPRHPDILTPREWEVLALLRERLTNEQIAERLSVTVHAARYHVSEILSKLGVASREEAAAWQPPSAESRRADIWTRALEGAVVVGAIALFSSLALLAFGAFRTSGGETGASTPASPSASVTGFVASTPPPDVGPNVRAMGMINGASGWLLTDDGLYRTSLSGYHETGGIYLVDITPPGVSAAEIKGVHYEGSLNWWMIASGAADSTNTAQLIAYLTIDGGISWQSSPLGEPEKVYLETQSRPAYIDFIDFNHGWVVVDTQQTMNSPSADLYRTEDGGATWAKLSIPTSAELYFANENDGWAVAGRVHDQLLATDDGGVSWQNESDITPYGLPAGLRMFELPQAVGSEHLLLPVTQLVKGGAPLFQLFSSDNGGQTWEPLTSATIAGNFGAGVTAITQIFDDGSVVSFAPDGTALLYSPRNSELQEFLPDGLTGAPSAIDFADQQRGWALVQQSGCRSFKSDCWSVNYVEWTKSGGQTWKPLVAFSASPTP